MQSPDAYCPHLGAHLGHGGIINGECIECPFHAWRWKTDVDSSGNFILYLGGESNSQNFLPLPENANMLIVRQTYKNRISQTHAKINIKTVSSAAAPELLTPSRP